MSKDRVSRVHTDRIAPYITPRRALHPEAGSFGAAKVKEAPSLFDRGRHLAYVLFKAAPLMYAGAPNVLTGALVVANALDNAYHARHGGIADKLEAFALLGGGISGAAAQTISYAYQGNNQLRATWGTQSASINCTSPHAFRRNETGIVGDYLACNLQVGQYDIILANQPNLIASTPALPIPPSGIAPECTTAFNACAPSRPTVPPPVGFTYVGNNQIRADSTGNPLVNCTSNKAFRSIEPVARNVPLIKYPYCDLTANSFGGRLGDLASLGNTLALPVSTDIQPVCDQAKAACNSQAPSITFTKIPADMNHGDRLHIQTNGRDTAQVDCNTDKAFRNNVSYYEANNIPAYLTCSLQGNHFLGLRGHDPNLPVLPINSTQMQNQCDIAYNVCNPAPPPPHIAYTKIDGNKLKATWSNGTATIDCGIERAFRTNETFSDTRPNNMPFIAADYCYTTDPGFPRREEVYGNSPALPIPLGQINEDCSAAGLICNPPPAMPKPLEATPTPTPIGVRTPITLTPATPEIIEAAPKGINVIGVALGIPVSLGFIAVFASCAGVMGWLVYKENKKNGRIEVIENPSPEVVVELNRLRVTDELRVKFEEVAVAKLPLV